MLHAILPSPIGDVLVTGTETELTGLWFADKVPVPVGSRHADEPFQQVRDELAAYWDRALADFTIPIAPPGTTWQRLVWEALRQVPYGTTLGYGELAARLGKPTASRAVGAANGRNPISVIVPCHRLVGSTGDLVRYGGGIERKRWLIDHEARAAA